MAKLSDYIRRAYGRRYEDTMWFGLYSWLGHMATCGGDGTRIRLGEGRERNGKKPCCRFGWVGFYLKDDQELQGLVSLAVRQWCEANPR